MGVGVGELWIPVLPRSLGFRGRGVSGFGGLGVSGFGGLGVWGLGFRVYRVWGFRGLGV